MRMQGFDCHSVHFYVPLNYGKLISPPACTLHQHRRIYEEVFGGAKEGQTIIYTG